MACGIFSCTMWDRYCSMWGSFNCGSQALHFVTWDLFCCDMWDLHCNMGSFSCSMQDLLVIACVIFLVACGIFVVACGILSGGMHDLFNCCVQDLCCGMWDIFLFVACGIILLGHVKSF